MNILPNAYYNYLKDAKRDYQCSKEKICHIIKDIYHDLGGNVGHRFMKVFLEREQIFLSKTTIHKYMNQEMHLYAVSRHKKLRYKKIPAHKQFPNLLKQNFVATEPNRVWCTDFTYLYLSNGMVRYNCTIIDLFDRSVVASENGNRITSTLAIRTLTKALYEHKCNPSKLLLHSYQGVQFSSLEFTSFCSSKGITQSMSRAVMPYDNAPMERYYNTLKAELINQYHFHTDKELNDAVKNFTYDWYNQIRPHSYNNYLTPHEKRYSLGLIR